MSLEEGIRYQLRMMNDIDEITNNLQLPLTDSAESNEREAAMDAVGDNDRYVGSHHMQQ